MAKLTRREILRAGTMSMAAGVVAGCSQTTLGPAGAPEGRVAAAPLPLGPDEPIKTAFIGIGGRGSGLLNSYLKQPGQQVVAVCDVNKENLDRAAAAVEKAGGKAPQTYLGDADEFKKVLDRKDIHAVVTATPCFEHARIMLATIASGKHIYGEKPLAITVRDANACLAASQANPKLVVQVGFQWMASARFHETIDRIHQGEIGELIEGRFFRHNQEPSLIGWFSDRRKSGDWMLEQACHEFNVMNWVAGTTPLQAYGMGRNDLFRDIDPTRTGITDYYAAIIEYPKNFIVHYAHGWISPKLFGEMGQKAIGTKGAIEIGGNHLTMRGGNPQRFRSKTGDDTDAAIAAFVDSVRNGKPPVAPVINGRNASLLALMVRKAVDERRVVTWEEILRTG